MTLEEQIQNLTAERDAAQADLKAIGECVGGDPLAVRGLVESMDAVIKERDAALEACRIAGVGAYKADYFLGRLTETGQLRQDLNAALKACASFRDAFDALHDYVRCNRNDPEGIAQIINGVQASDCGKGYHRDDEWKPVVEALRKIAGLSQQTCTTFESQSFVATEVAREALAHAERLTKQ